MEETPGQGLTEEELTIRIHHVGGIGGYGPAEVLDRLGKVLWVVYDAQADSLERSEVPTANYRLVARAIGGPELKRGKFYVTEWPSASGLLEPSKRAQEFTRVLTGGRLQVWGAHTKVLRSFDVDLSTLDELVEGGLSPQADFLSVDAQGAELPILEGASNMLRETVVGVVCEVEFTALYEGQPLIDDTYSRLRKDRFRLCEIFNKQYFNVKPFPPEIQGMGFLTVGEALFLREGDYWISDDEGGTPSTRAVVQSLKLAAVAVAFDQLDYALDICDRLEKRLVSLAELSARTNVLYVTLLRDLQDAAKEIRSKRKPLSEARETDSVSEGPAMPHLLPRVGGIVIRLMVGRAIGVIARWSREKNDGASRTPSIPRVLHEYGFEELAIKQAFRAMNIPKPGAGLRARLLETLIRLVVRLS